MLDVLKQFKLHYWPALTCIWFMLTFAISYTLAVINGHVYPIFPFVSDTGTTPPESCLFGQMMNIAAVFMAISMYIRYRQIDFILNSNEVALQKSLNETAFWVGNVTCLGISMVGNFQETALLSVHLIGAFLAFGIGGVYLIIQTRFSAAFRHLNYKNPEYGVGQYLLFTRVVLTALFFISMFTMIISFPIAQNKFTGDNILWWTEEHGGYGIRLIATFSEWILVIDFILYTGTTIKEFKALEFEGIYLKSKYVDNMQEMN